MTGKNKTIQDKITELNQLVDWFDSDEFVLEQAIDKFKEAEALAATIKTELQTMKNEVTVLADRFDSDAG